METDIQSLVFTCLTKRDLRLLFREEMEAYFSLNIPKITLPLDVKKPFNIDEAASFLGISKNPIYSKINEIPHSKIGKRLIFTEDGLLEYLVSVRKKTVTEIEADSEAHLGSLGEKKRLLKLEIQKT